MTTWPQCIVMESVTESFPVLVLRYEALCEGSENVICLVVQQAELQSPPLYQQSLLFDRRQRSVCGVFPELPCSKPIIRHFSPIFSNLSFHHISLSSLTSPSRGNSTARIKCFLKLIRLVADTTLMFRRLRLASRRRCKFYNESWFLMFLWPISKLSLCTSILQD